jgi:site-specific DNA-methyltransferase (adenine-specific)
MVDKLGPYELNTIMTGDARELVKAIPNESVDLIVSDPPYGIGYASSWKTRKNGLPRKNVSHFDEDILDTSFISDYIRILSIKGAIYLFTRWDVLPIWKNAIENNGGYINQRLIWNKTHWGMGDLRFYGSQTEDILFCTKGDHHLRWNKREGNILAANTYLLPEGQFDHPTQKPESIISKMIVNSSDPGNIVLDLHCGSGTVAVCAKKLGRQFLCADIKAKYVNMARQRVANTQPPLPIVHHEQLLLVEVKK